MTKKYLLGIDVGTTGTKTLLFSEDGIPCRRSYCGYPLSTPSVGYSEQSAEELWLAVVKTVREVCHELDGEVAAISLSTQGGTLIPVDCSGTPLCPAIVWNDSRCAEEYEKYIAEVGSADTMYEKSGWRLSSGLVALQIRHLRDNSPEVFGKAAKFLSVPDYIALKMTGIAAIDLSNLGINQLGNIREHSYDKELLAFAGISEDMLPRIVCSGEKIGYLTESAAEELGLSSKVALVSGAHDQYAVALGAGAINDGDILIGSGTCWVVTAISSSPCFDSGLSQSIAAASGLWGSIFSLSSGGVCLEWLRNNIAKSDECGLIDFATLDDKASRCRAAENGLYFFPFSGTHGDGELFTRASFIGLDLSHDRFHFARAIMEGIAFQMLWIMDSFGTRPSGAGLILSGGASRSALWTKLVADISGLPVRVPELADLACVGAAMLAGIGVGLYSDATDAYSKFAVKERICSPDMDEHRKYISCFNEYKRIAKGLGLIYKNLK